LIARDFRETRRIHYHETIAGRRPVCRRRLLTNINAVAEMKALQRLSCTECPITDIKPLELEARS
jgi:hypothetical protein